MTVYNVKQDIRSGLHNTLNLISVVIIFVLGARIILRILEANTSTPFVIWINSMSDKLIYPFNGIFPNLDIQGSGIFDVVAAVALIIYLLLIYLIIETIDYALSNPTQLPQERILH